LLFLIFLVSVLVLEGILQYDKVETRKLRRLPVPKPLLPGPHPTPHMDRNTTDTSNVLTLAKAIEEHSKEAGRPTMPEPSRAGSSSKLEIRPVATTGSRPLK
jgi:hypothetical protein